MESFPKRISTLSLNVLSVTASEFGWRCLAGRSRASGAELLLARLVSQEIFGCH